MSGVHEHYFIRMGSKVSTEDESAKEVPSRYDGGDVVNSLRCANHQSPHIGTTNHRISKAIAWTRRSAFDATFYTFGVVCVLLRD